MAVEPDKSALYGTFHGEATSNANGKTRTWRRALGAAIGACALLVASYAFVSTTTTSAINGDAAVTMTASSRQDTDTAAIETLFLQGIDREKLREFLHAYASKPHPAGTHQDYKTALYTAKQFEKFGLKAEIKTYYPLLSSPKRAARVSITAPANAARKLNLTEAQLPSDACTTSDEATPPYLAYSRSGNLTASVVYVNYGRPEDLQWLVDHGVTLKGKIALARYGKNYRGLKVLVAEQHGMAGTLIYSDPQDDGFGIGVTYPNGPWRPKNSFQRGSAENPSLYAGDPLTPGFASVKGAPYISIEDANIPHTLATVLSYEQASYILESLGGRKAPAEWQGDLTLSKGSYYIGDDAVTEVHMDLDMDNSIKPIWDVIGTIEGSDEHVVIIGNHRDAWVCGALDPSSGSAAMLEIARGLGKLLQKGWKPRRTIKLASWDGEEMDLLGSTEYAEDHREELLKSAVTYINVDLTYGPIVSASATPSIAQFMFDTAKSVPANQFYGNETEKTLYDQWVNQRAQARAVFPEIDKLTLAPDHLISFLGAGSDYTVFYVHLGITSADLTFGFKDATTYGTYHSTMDSPVYLESVADPLYNTQAATSQWWGLLALRFATLPVLPFDFSTYGIAMHRDLDNWELQTKAIGLGLDYTALRKAIDQFLTKSTAFTSLTMEMKMAYGKGTMNDQDMKPLNEKLKNLERQFIAPNGLPHRPWFRHVIFGPGFYDGYAGAAFPGIADGILFTDDAQTMQNHLGVVAEIVQKAAEFLTL